MDVREKLEVIAHLGDHITYKEDIGIFYDSELAKVIEDAYMTLKNGVTVQEWISVKDRLPEKPMKCLVYTKRGEYGGYEITYYNEGFYLQYANVTHWMPLPDEPEVKND